jgi:protein-disulfide isomerase
MYRALQETERTSIMKNLRNAGAAAGAILITILATFAAQSNPPVKQTAGKPAHDSASTEPPSHEKLVSFIRERFGVVSTVQLSLSELQPSADPNFYQATITSNDGKQSKDQPISVSKDGRYLFMGPLVPLSGNADAAGLAQQVREQFKLHPEITVTATELKPSKYPGFLTTQVTASDGTHPAQTLPFFVTDDKKFMTMSSEIYRLNVDPRKEALRTISLKDQPTQGAANAPVTVVEFADLECPSCARLHQYLETEFMPKYGSRVRVVFKEFPLPMHQWGRFGAIANECAYQMDPSKFVTYRTLIFQHQPDVDAVQANSSQVRDLLLSYGEQSGLDRGKLGVCYDSQASKARVDAGRQEGEDLGVNQTPTVYVNGRFFPGPSPEVFVQAVEDALAEAKSSSTRAAR